MRKFCKVRVRNNCKVVSWQVIVDNTRSEVVPTNNLIKKPSCVHNGAVCFNIYVQDLTRNNFSRHAGIICKSGAEIICKVGGGIIHKVRAWIICKVRYDLKYFTVWFLHLITSYSIYSCAVHTLQVPLHNIRLQPKWHKLKIIY